MVDSPHAIYPGMDEQDYYRGLVTEAAPGTVRQVAVSKGESPQDGRRRGDAERPRRTARRDGGRGMMPRTAARRLRHLHR